MEKGEITAAGDLISVNIKFRGRSIPVSLSPDSTVRDLKSLLQPLTQVLPCCQKLIFKGRILDDDGTLRSSEVSNGAKIMLIASQGLHQGVGPMGKQAPTSSRKMKKYNANPDIKGKRELTVQKSKFESWKGTGLIAFSGCKLRIKLQSPTPEPKTKLRYECALVM